MKKIYFVLVAIILVVFTSCSLDSSLSEFDNSSNSGMSGSIKKFVINGDFMYVLNNNEIQTYDVSNSDKPILKNSIRTDYGLETITVYDGYVYVGSTTSLYILNIDDASAPIILSKTDRNYSFTGCDPVAVKGNYAYSTVKIIANICGTVNTTSALIVFDVHDKRNPREIKRIPMSMPNGLAFVRDYLLVCDAGANEVVVFDVSDLENPIHTNYSFDLEDPVDLIINGNKGIISTKNSFDIYDLSDIADIKKIGFIGT
ncbi:MAG: hypothetical protein KA010_03500 [Saprospiraceae bacterium]|nr:hypothetical protein [Saprospiraceae bacterium]